MSPLLTLLALTLPAAGAPGPAVAAAEEIIEVKAKLVEIPGNPPPNDLYDYAYVMKYQVEGGALDGRTIYVAHFNPRQARAKVRPEMRKWVSGTLLRFKVGAVHQMRLTPRIDQIWKNAIEDHYESDARSPRYWCLTVDPVT